MPRKIVTLADVASAAGVSVTTASLVLSGRGDELRISAAAQAKVREAAEKLGWRPNAVSIGLRTGSTHTLGFVSDTVATSGLANGMIQGALQAARQHRFMLFIAESQGSAQAEQELIDAMIDRRVDGIVLATMFTRQHELPDGLDKVPTVLLNALPDRPASLDAVLPDELTAGREAAQLLLDAGHRKIHLLGAGPGPSDGPPHSIAARERLTGITEALAAAGLAPVGYQPVADWVPMQGRAAMRRLLAEDPNPGAIICFNDRLALGAYQVLSDWGLNVPADVSIVSFDDHEIADWMRPALTTFAIPHQEMGRIATELVIERIGRPEAESGHRHTHRVKLPLRLRSSVATHSGPAHSAGPTPARRTV